MISSTILKAIDRNKTTAGMRESLRMSLSMRKFRFLIGLQRLMRTIRSQHRKTIRFREGEEHLKTRTRRTRGRTTHLNHPKRQSRSNREKQIIGKNKMHRTCTQNRHRTIRITSKFTTTNKIGQNKNKTTKDDNNPQEEINQAIKQKEKASRKERNLSLIEILKLSRKAQAKRGRSLPG